MLPRAELYSILILPLGIGLVMQASPDVSTDRVSPNAEHVAVSYADEVQPIFDQHCVECHGNENTELGLNLATYEGAMAGSDYGTVIEPGNPGGSLLIDMMESGDMPEDADPVPAEEIEIIKTWISEGAENN